MARLESEGLSRWRVQQAAATVTCWLIGKLNWSMSVSHGGARVDVQVPELEPSQAIARDVQVTPRSQARVTTVVETRWRPHRALREVVKAGARASAANVAGGHAAPVRAVMVSARRAGKRSHSVQSLGEVDRTCSASRSVQLAGQHGEGSAVCDLTGDRYIHWDLAIPIYAVYT